MALRKITIIAIFLVPFLHACNNQDNWPAKQRRLQMKLNKDQMLQQMTHDLLFQDSILRLINLELENIDNLFLNFEGNIERNATTPTQAQSIVQRIRKLDETMNAMRNELKNSTLKNKGLVEMIERIQKELMIKEKRIAELQEMVVKQEKELAMQEKLITGLKTSNDRQQQDLQRLETEISSMKALAYIDLADLLLQIAEGMPDIRGIFNRKSKINIENMHLGLIKDAYRYYDEAALLGNSDAAAKQSALKRNYAFLR